MRRLLIGRSAHFHCIDYFVIGGIRNCLEVSIDPMFLWISSNSCPLNLLLVRSHKAEIIIVKRLIQGRNSVTRVRVQPRSFDQGIRKNDSFTHSATLPIIGSRTRSEDQFLYAKVQFILVSYHFQLVPPHYVCCGDALVVYNVYHNIMISRKDVLLMALY